MVMGQPTKFPIYWGRLKFKNNSRWSWWSR